MEGLKDISLEGNKKKLNRQLKGRSSSFLKIFYYLATCKGTIEGSGALAYLSYYSCVLATSSVCIDPPPLKKLTLNSASARYPIRNH